MNLLEGMFMKSSFNGTKLNRALYTLPLLAFASLQMACGSGPSSNSGDSVTAQAAAAAGEGISVDNATIVQCPAGGKVYTLFSDKNSNGTLDTGETVLSTQVVCNGQNGTNGTNGTGSKSMLFSMNRVTTGLSACASGAGVQINSGLDVNSNGSLDASEISQTQVLCDGKSGAVGAAGPAGSNGHGVVFQMVAASATQCPAGGTVILMAIDNNDNGTYSSTKPGQQSTVICNGKAAATTPYTPVEEIFPCGGAAYNAETLLRLANGDVVGTVSAGPSGAYTALAVIDDGSYYTTDGASCNFSLSSSADAKTRYFGWGGAIRESWPWL
jgi:hypothetical protein